jgi:hypothetical protein
MYICCSCDWMKILPIFRMLSFNYESFIKKNSIIETNAIKTLQIYFSQLLIRTSSLQIRLESRLS